MHDTDSSTALTRFAVSCGVAALLVACSDSRPTEPVDAPDVLQLTTKQIGSLDSTGHVITQANPGNATLKSLVDSTLLVLTAGVEAKRLDVTTNLTTKPLYFVGVHRAVSRGGGAFSTWTLVGLDDPSKLTSVVEVSGFAQTATATPPASVSGTIGDGAGAVNGALLAVGDGGSVTMWPANNGTASFTSIAGGASCPNFPVTPNVTCTLETMRVRFTMSAPAVSGQTARSASLSTDIDVPTMRLTYTF
ncbi:MAG TPA: hypothetical protein VM076_14330 [Gemmatimonadaceae bacterium]|nr:hypothetical protein [Gemmatimonadaceae bacterium]